MRTRIAAVAVVVAFVAVGHRSAAQAPAPAAAPKLFAAAGDLTAMIERAKKERKPDQANFIQPVVQLRPYTVNLEYRVAGLNAPASVHEKEAELFYVVEGSGMAVTGGKLKDERRTNPENLQGSAIDGGSSRRVAKGDVLFVPEKTPHWFTQIDGALVMMSLHVPRTE